MIVSKGFQILTVYESVGRLEADGKPHDLIEPPKSSLIYGTIGAEGKIEDIDIKLPIPFFVAALLGVK